jgi:hypothetical protein
MSESLFSYAKCPALCLSSYQVVVRGDAPDWLSGRATRYRLIATQAQCGVLGI